MAPLIKKLTSKRAFNREVWLLQIGTALVIRNCGNSYYKSGQISFLQIGATSTKWGSYHKLVLRKCDHRS